MYNSSSNINDDISLNEDCNIGQLNQLTESKDVIFIPVKKVNRLGYVHHPQLIYTSDKLPSNIKRSSYTHMLIECYGLLHSMSIIEPTPASKEQLLEFHSRDYIGILKSNYRLYYVCRV